MLSVMVLLLMLNEHVPVIDEQSAFVESFFSVLYSCAGCLAVSVMLTVRAQAVRYYPNEGSIRFPPLICTYTPWGVRADEVAKSIPTR